MNVNKIMLMGRITADLELQYTKSNIAVVRFTVAVNRPRQKDTDPVTDFIECVAFDKKAEFITKYFSKGSPIILFGTLQTGTYTDKDGNKRKSWTVFTNEVQFAGTKKETKPSATVYPDEKPAANDGYFDEVTDIDDELPF